MRARAYGIGIVVFAAAAYLAGCGGSGQQATPPSAQPSAGAASGETAKVLPLPGQEQGAAGAELPSGHPPVGSGTTGQLMPPPPGAGSGAEGLTWKLPDGWVEENPSSSMRRAQAKVPGPGGDGEFVVFYFGPGQGGDPHANAVRWAGQFKQPDGSNSVDKMKTTETTVNGIKVLRVEVTGEYFNPMGSMTEPMKNAELLGAIVEGPDAQWFFKLTGPEPTIEANRAKFDALVGSVKLGG